MTPAARLATIIAALTEIRETPKPADVVLSKFFRARRFIGAKDRGAMATAVYRILRCEARLEWWLWRTQVEATPRAFVLADTLLNEQTTVDELNSLCNGGQYAPPRLDKHEHDMALQMEGQPLNHAEMPDYVRYECPEWIWPKLEETFGAELPTLLAAMQEPAALDLRVNTLKADKATLLRELQAVGWKVEETKFSPHGLRLHGRPNLNSHPALQNGLMEIQDEGSQLIALVADTKPGMRVLDFCAGAGGKTLAMAASMANKGRIIACDILESRLKRGSLRFRRAGAHNIDIQPLKNETDPWLKRHKDSFDRVLVDAPCSGTGTWRRNPEARWRQLGPDMEKLLATQASILASAARLVKPGGRLIYATCSILPDENQQQVDNFLTAHPEFTRLNVSDEWASWVDDRPCPVTGTDLSLNPATHNTDGFYAAVLVRNQ